MGRPRENPYLNFNAAVAAARAHVENGVLPAANNIRQTNSQLAHAINEYHGIREIRKALGASSPKRGRQQGPLADFDNLRREVLRVMEIDRKRQAEKKGTPVEEEPLVFPPRSRLENKKDLNRQDVAHAARKYHGGWAELAKKMGYSVKTQKWKKGELSDINVLLAELKPILEAHDGKMPSRNVLADFGREDLVRAIQRYHGGFTKFRETSNLERHQKRKWTREKVIKEIQGRHAESKPLHPTGIQADDNALWGAMYSYPGSYETALKTLGLDPSEVKKKVITVKRAAPLKNFEAFAEEFERIHERTGISPWHHKINEIKAGHPGLIPKGFRAALNFHGNLKGVSPMLERRRVFLAKNRKLGPLVCGMRKGNESATQKFMEHVGKIMNKKLWGAIPPHAMEDAVAEAQYRAFFATQHFDYTRNDNFNRYLYPILDRAKTDAIIYWTRKKRDHRKTRSLNQLAHAERGKPDKRTMADNIPAITKTPEEIVLDKETDAELERLRKMGERLRPKLVGIEARVFDAFSKQEIGKVSYEEVARELGVEVKSIDNALKRIKEKAEKMKKKTAGNGGSQA